MAQRVRDILLRIRGDASDAQQDLHNLARELKQFDGTVAEAKVDVNTQAIERKVEAAKRSVKEFGRLSEAAKIDLQDRAAQAKLDRLNQQLANLQERDASPKIDIAIGRTVAQIERVEHQLDRLDRRRVDINIDVDRRGGLGGLLGRLGRSGGGSSRLGGDANALATGASHAAVALGSATVAMGAFAAGASQAIPLVGHFADSLIQIGKSALELGPALLVIPPLIAALTIAFAVVAAQIVLLVGAVVALGASLLTAAAGIGVLGTALAAAFGPVVLVAIAAMARFAKILDAVKQKQDGAVQSAQTLRDAHQAQAAAQRNAADAAERVKTTAVDAYRAWSQAAEDTRDAIRGIAQAELSRDQAALNVKKAEQALKDLRAQAGLAGHAFDELFNKFTDASVDTSGLAGAIENATGGSQVSGASSLDLQQAILDLRSARLGEKDAIDGVSDAHTRLNDARTRENQFIQNGISAYEPYTAAVKANADAQQAVADAVQNTADAQDKQNQALKDLTPREKTLVGVLVTLQKTLTDASRPATEAIFGGVLDALKDLSDFAKDPQVRHGLTAIGDAIGDMFRVMGRELRRKEFRDAFSEFAAGGAQIIRELTPVFRSLFRIIVRLAEDALPWLLSVIHDIGRGIRHWAGDIDKSDIEAFIKRVRRSFSAWIGVVEELWLIVKEFFGDANDSGDELAETIRKILYRFRLWLEENPDNIKKFFQDAKDDAELFLGTLVKIATAIHDINTAVNNVTKNHPKGPDIGEQFNPFNMLRNLFRQHGGVIPGSGRGDIVPAMLEPGEFVIRRSVAEAIGIPRLNLINSGQLGTPTAALSGAPSHTYHVGKIEVTSPAGTMMDPTVAAVKMARVLERRGGGSRH
jgi:hypothetical protein